MKITNSINNGISLNKKSPPAVFRGLPAKKITDFFLKNGNVGEKTSVLIDIFGKAVLVPIVIIFNGFSKQPKEEKKYSAIKNPTAALIQLGLEVPIFYYATKGVKNLANKGLLDKDPNFSYNAKLHKNIFIESLDRLIKSNPPNPKIAKEITGLRSQLDKKGLTQKLIHDFNQVISKITSNSSSMNLKNQTKDALNNYNTVNKRLFQLGSRFSFLAALLLIPVVCGIENWLHPKIMKILDNRKNKKVNAGQISAGNKIGCEK